VRSQAWRIGNNPLEEIMDSTLAMQLPDQGDGVGTVESGSEDEQRNNAAPDSATGQGRVGNGEVPLLGREDGREAVNEAGPFFSNS
jgi:hypothetical protein